MRDTTWADKQAQRRAREGGFKVFQSCSDATLDKVLSMCDWEFDELRGIRRDLGAEDDE